MYTRKYDLNQKEKTTVRYVFGGIMGACLLYVTFFILLPHVGEDGIDKYDWIGLGALTGFSLLAMLPWIFLEILGDVLKIIKEKFQKEN